VRKKLGKPAPAENSEPDVSNGPDCGDERQLWCDCHGGIAPMSFVNRPLSRSVFGYVVLGSEKGALRDSPDLQVVGSSSAQNHRWHMDLGPQCSSSRQDREIELANARRVELWPEVGDGLTG
jgi:hypothetical protein